MGEDKLSQIDGQNWAPLTIYYLRWPNWLHELSSLGIAYASMYFKQYRLATIIHRESVLGTHDATKSTTVGIPGFQEPQVLWNQLELCSSQVQRPFCELGGLGCWMQPLQPSEPQLLIFRWELDVVVFSTQVGLQTRVQRATTSGPPHGLEPLNIQIHRYLMRLYQRLACMFSLTFFNQPHSYRALCLTNYELPPSLAMFHLRLKTFLF